jgi:hypothetical protein
MHGGRGMLMFRVQRGGVVLRYGGYVDVWGCGGRSHS